MFASSAAVSSFSFGFAAPSEADAAAELKQADDDEARHFIINNNSNSINVGVILNDYVCASNFSVRKGERVRIDWDQSTYYALHVTTLTGDGDSGNIPPLHVAIEYNSSNNCCCGLVDNGTLVHFDTLFAPARRLTPAPHYISTPLSLEPGLNTFVWPLTAAEFKSRVYRQRALVLHGGTERLSLLRAAFDDFDVSTMLDHASSIIVWMRSLSGGMNYLNADGNPDVAKKCYDAGHSLYFNPPVHVQKQYVTALGIDLGMDFGIEKTGEFGGDIEVFAVRGRHHTPWHFDAQHNFTIQVRGTKRWRLARPSPNNDPLSNLHPHSTNTASIRRDMRLHRMCSTHPLPDQQTLDECAQEFVLRPGSVMYFPAGMWHEVYADDADTGSLSINISLDGARWSDVLMSRLTPLLASHESWRERVHVQDVTSARQHFQTLLTQLQNDLTNMSAEDFLPDIVFRKHRLPLVSGNGGNDDDDEEEDGDISLPPMVEIDHDDLMSAVIEHDDTMLVCRNEVAVMTPDTLHTLRQQQQQQQPLDDGVVRYVVQFGHDMDHMLRAHTVIYTVPVALNDLFVYMCILPPRTRVSIKDIVAAHASIPPAHIHHTITRLLNARYIRRHQQ